MNLAPLQQLIRRVRKTPGFAAVTLLTLAVGIGANTAIFSVMNGVLFKPLPYPESERLIGLWLSAEGLQIPELNASAAQHFTYRDEARTFEYPALYDGTSVVVSGGLNAEPEQVDALDATYDLFLALRTVPAAGRLFAERDGDAGSPRTVVLTHGFLASRFGGDAAKAIGTRLILDGNAHEIIGVLPRDFRFLDLNPQLILPMQLDRGKTEVGNFSFKALARLKPGATMAQASADVDRMMPIMLRKFKMPPGFSLTIFEQARFRSNLRFLHKDVVGNIATLLWVLAGTVGIVLFIACANVANLLLVRAEGRQQEFAIRTALGARRMDLVRELLSESLVLSLCGGVLGMGVCYALLRLLIALAPAQLPRLGEIGMDPVVFAFALGVSLAAGLLFGLVPVYKYAGPQAASVIRDGGRTSSQGRERHRARAVLVIAQVALAVVLLVGAGLMMRSFQALLQVDPGFQKPEEVLAVSIAVPQAQIPNVDHVAELYRDILRRVSGVPGVQSVAIAANLPMDGNTNFNPLYLEDRTYKEGELPPLRRHRFTAPGLLGTLGVPIVAGRDFTWEDLRNRAHVVLVSENFAREAWGDPAQAVGKRVRESLKGTWREIVGVTGDVRDDGLSQPAPKAVHFPLLVNGVWEEGDRIRRWVSVTVRSPRTGTSSFVTEVRTAIREANSGVPIATIRTLKQLKDRSMARTSFTLVMLGLASFMALLLGVVGIYGVISYSVSQRTREIGIRTALGASAGEVRGMFLRHAMLLAGTGVVLGLGVSTALTRWMSALLYGISPLDAVTFAVVPVILTSAACVAAYLPARRATRLDPMNALRME